MHTKLRYADLVLMSFVVAIAAMLIVPLPTGLLDVLLVVNLSFSILLLLVGLYVANSAALYTFPTILLLSTLFRLGLNVASSRLILSQGDAGRVIEAFGTFLIRGEVLVGVIIFAIVTVVNFIVISKGALRVSEVAARFALDALPGKQMVIDNDARAGLLSAEEARKKRDELRRESQLYGSMDGAMKFVQGDAIAGLFIIAVNICGGMFMGVSGGLSLSDAVGQYTVLTVGDGLVTQIPGLLTSICAGIIVTRVSSSEASSLSADLRSQLFSQPLALIVTSAILLLFALLPGLPTIPFLAVALVAGVAGVILYRRQGSHSDLAPAGDFSRMTGLPLPAGGEGDSESESDAIIIQLDSAVLYRSYRASVSKYVSWWNTFRSSLHSDVGLLLPNVRVVSDDLGATSSYRVTHGGIEMFSGRVLPDALLVEISCSHAPILGLKVLEREDHPLSGHRIFWTNYSPKTRKMLEAASIRSYDFFEFLGLRIAGFALQHPEEFLSATDVHSLLRQVEKRHPGLIGEGFGREFVSIPKLTEILQELIRQGLTIRDFKSIAEGVASFCSSTGTTLDNDSSVDVAAVVDHMRTGRRRQMLRRFIGSAKTLRVITLSEELEQLLQDSEVESRSLSLAIESETFDAVGRGLQAVLKPTLENGVFPVAILCPDAVKSKVVAFTRSTTKRIFVLTFGELEPAIPVEQVGIWGVASR